MSVPNIVPYEADLSFGYVVQPADWNGSFDNITNYINSTLVPAINSLNASVQGVPAGSIVPWWNTGSVPAGWALCNGQTTTWLTGPQQGNSVTLPNLIGMVIQGSDITGGASTANANGFGSQANQSQQGAKTHTHTVSITSQIESADTGQFSGASTGFTYPSIAHTHLVSGTTASANLQPPVYCLAYIMKL